MKKRQLVLALGVVLLSSCTSNIENTLLGLINDLSLSLRFNVKLTKNDVVTNYMVDDLSFIENNTTYYKYRFKDKYQKYHQNVVENDIENIEYGKYFTQLVNRVLFSPTNFDILDEVYTLKEESYSKFDVSFLDNDNLTLFKVSKKDDDIVLFNLEFGLDKYSLEYTLSDKEIYPYQVKEEDYHSFYQKTMIDFDEAVNKEEDYVLVITSFDCSSCELSEKDYFLFNYELNKPIYSIEKEKITTEQRKQFLPSMVEAYKNQGEEFQHQSFSSYPDNRFLTPTAVRFVNKKVKYVYLGISKYNVNAFYNFSFN